RLVNHRNIFHISFSAFQLVLFGYCFTFFVKSVVSVNTQPVHLSAAAYLIFTYNRYVVFNVTSYNTSSATGTSIKVDSHYPVMSRLVVFIPKIVGRMLFAVVTATVCRIFLVICKSSFAD